MRTFQWSGPLGGTPQIKKNHKVFSSPSQMFSVNLRNIIPNNYCWYIRNKCKPSIMDCVHQSDGHSIKLSIKAKSHTLVHYWTSVNRSLLSNSWAFSKSKANNYKCLSIRDGVHIHVPINFFSMSLQLIKCLLAQSFTFFKNGIIDFDFPGFVARTLYAMDFTICSFTVNCFLQSQGIHLGVLWFVCLAESLFSSLRNTNKDTVSYLLNYYCKFYFLIWYQGML